jgi:hypothetical protein
MVTCRSCGERPIASGTSRCSECWAVIARAREHRRQLQGVTHHQGPRVIQHTSGEGEDTAWLPIIELPTEVVHYLRDREEWEDQRYYLTQPREDNPRSRFYRVLRRAHLRVAASNMGRRCERCLTNSRSRRDSGACESCSKWVCGGCRTPNGNCLDCEET